MLESSLDPILHSSTLQTIEHTPSHQRTFEEHYRRQLIELCEQPLSHPAGSYARLRAEETSWPRICALLDTLTRQHATTLKLATALIQEACTPWSDRSRTAPAAWLERAMSGEEVFELAIVRHIDLGKRSLSLEMLEHLCQQPHLSRISILRLDEAELSSLAGRLLGQHPCLDNLRELYLNHNPDLGNRGVSNLLEQGRFTHLEVLSLAGCNVRDEALFKLCQNDSIQQLTYLDLHDNALTDRGVCVLALSSNLSRLQHLYLYHNQGIADQGARALLHRRDVGFPCLETADLHDCAIKDETLCQKLSLTPAT